MNFSNAARQLYDLQRGLYQKALSEAQSYISIQTKSLGRYGAEFYNCLPDRFNLSTVERLTNEVLRSDITLYGDFHTLRQSQRGFLRLLRNLHQCDPKRKIMVALEMFSAQDQNLVNSYLNGNMKREVFLEKISYEEKWGFSFNNYEPILEAAKEFGYKIVGVNAASKKLSNSIASRDQLIANNILNIMNEHPGHLVVCLIGEFHIADIHLPRQLKRFSSRGEKLDVCKIVTNVDSYYFDLPPAKVSGHTEYLELADNFFCIMNTSPWIKWQSLVNWELLKQVGCSVLDNDEVDDFNDDGIDVEYQIVYLAKELAKFLDMSIDKASLENIYSYFLYSEDGLIDAEIDFKQSAYDIRGLVTRVQLDGFYYHQPTFEVALNKLSLNHLARVSGQHLQAVLSKVTLQGPASSLMNFYLEVLKVAAGSFAAKSLNPKRKTADLTDYSEFVQKTNRKRLIGHARTHRDNSRFVLKHHELLSEWSGPNALFKRSLKPLIKFDQGQAGILAHSIGSMLGLRLSDRLVDSKVSPDEIKRLFSYTVSSEDDFLGLVFNLYRMIL